MNTILILHDIRSAYNVGSLFRTADAAAIEGIILSGYTPAPIDRFGKPNKEIVKTALGAELAVPWKQVKQLSSYLKKLKKDGFSIIAIEQSKISVSYRKVKKQKKIALILGNEVTGIGKNILVHADIIAEIPMRGEKESLNVSVAGGIALFQILGI